jgi:hypothetical protein
MVYLNGLFSRNRRFFRAGNPDGPAFVAARAIRPAEGWNIGIFTRIGKGGIDRVDRSRRRKMRQLRENAADQPPR